MTKTIEADRFAAMRDDAPMSNRTAASLIEVCLRAGEPVDTALTEGQARERIRILLSTG
ncbi:MAG: hypothetical protein AAGF60_11765 [Pseudomonadota bacterium]